MENVHLTPLKSDPDVHSAIDAGKVLSFSTPNSSSCPAGSGADDGAGIDSLSGSFTGMKLNAHIADGGGALKRSVDRFTVEGSPMVPLPFKQPNLNHTPLAFAQAHHSSTEDTSGILENDAYSHCIDRLSPILETVEAQVSTGKQGTSRKVLVICSASNEHNTGDHQENMLRTALLCGEDGCLRRPELSSSIDWINSDTIQPASLCDLLRVHEYSYLAHLATKSQHAAKHQAGESTSNASGYPPFYAPQGMLDTDTPLLPQSLEAAKRFCGAAMLAVDYAMEDMFHCHTGSDSTVATNSRDRVFVIGRPPGHHAGPNGCVISKHHWQRPDMTSSGFCLLNTVAVAAAYARYQYGRLCLRSEAMSLSNPSTSSAVVGHIHPRPPRIAIVDIDIHHGNGTEDIVRNLSPRQVFLPLPSSWSPVSTLNYKPWLNEHDADDVLFSSIHLYAGERFYPCSGEERDPGVAGSTIAADRNIINICLTPLGPGPWDFKGRQKLSNTHREELCAAASKEFRSKVSTMLLPQMKSFAPDLLFISAGFDAHYDDAYHFLTESDVHWVTEQLCVAANGNKSSGDRRCKVISVLEGGYSLSSAIPAPPKATKSNSKAATLAASVSTAVPTVVSPAATSKSAAVPAVDSGDKNRPVRSKAKKVYSADGIVSVPGDATSDVHVASHHPTAAVVPVIETVAVEVTDPHFMYAQKLGDGGLVKGVLAHVAALADKKSWK